MLKSALILAMLLPSVAYARDSADAWCSKDGKYAVSGFKVRGPGFTCELADPIPGAGTGLAAWKATCKGRMSGILVEDLGNYTDHAELQLPGSKTWIKVYACPKG